MDHDQRVVGHRDDFVERLRDCTGARARRDIDVEAFPAQELVADPPPGDQGDVTLFVEPGCVDLVVLRRKE